MTTPTPEGQPQGTPHANPPATEPGERRPLLDRAPGERYAAPPPSAASAADARLAALAPPLAVVLGGALAFTVLGGLVGVTTGLVILAVVIGWAVGKLVSPPALAAVVGLGAVLLGLAGIWLFGRIEGGVLDPIAYFNEVHGAAAVSLELLAGAGMAAAASR